MKDRETKPKKLTRLKRILDEIVVPGAMVLVAMAFGAGLYFQAGFGVTSALMAAVTIFLVMICAQSAFVGTQRAAQAVERVDALEAAYQGGLNGDSEQLAQLAAKVAKVEGLPDRVQQIEALAERIEALDQEVTIVRRDRSEVDPARIQRLAAEVDRLDARQEALRTQLQIESRERYEDLSAELKMLETLVKQMAENIAVSKRAAQEVTSAAKSPAVQADEVPPQGQSKAPLGEPDEPAQLQSLAEEHSRERGKLEEIVREKLSESVAEKRPEPSSQTQPEIADVEDVQQEPQALPAPEEALPAPEEARPAPEAQDVRDADTNPEPPDMREAAVQAQLEPPAGSTPVIDEVRKSIESNRIELFLQPIMIVPQRRVRYYEALTRLRNDAGELLMPQAYMGQAESAGIMSAIDNVMLFRSVQVLRRLEKRSSARGVFCNISVNSLLDPEFFPEFVAFMEQNRGLSESMYFEFSQAMIDHCGPVEQDSLATLASLGFRFSLDQVTNLDLDYQAMSERGFRFIKVDADVMLNGMAKANAQIHAVDMRSYLERFGIQLIVSKIENEAELARLLEYSVKLGQGFLFSEPRPVRPEIFGDQSSVAAA